MLYTIPQRLVPELWVFGEWLFEVTTSPRSRLVPLVVVSVHEPLFLHTGPPPLRFLLVWLPMTDGHVFELTAEVLEIHPAQFAHNFNFNYCVQGFSIVPKLRSQKKMSWPKWTYQEFY